MKVTMFAIVRCHWNIQRRFSAHSVDKSFSLHLLLHAIYGYMDIWMYLYSKRGPSISGKRLNKNAVIIIHQWGKCKQNAFFLGRVWSVLSFVATKFLFSASCLVVAHRPWINTVFWSTMGQKYSDSKQNSTLWCILTLLTNRKNQRMSIRGRKKKRCTQFMINV